MLMWEKVSGSHRFSVLQAIKSWVEPVNEARLRHLHILPPTRNLKVRYTYCFSGAPVSHRICQHSHLLYMSPFGHAIPSLVSCTEVTRTWKLLSHATNAVRCSHVIFLHDSLSEVRGEKALSLHTRLVRSMQLWTEARDYPDSVSRSSQPRQPPSCVWHCSLPASVWGLQTAVWGGCHYHHGNQLERQATPVLYNKKWVWQSN